MAISVEMFRAKSDKELVVGGARGATGARIVGFLSRNRKKAFTASEIYKGARYSAHGRPSGDFYAALNQLAKERKIVKKGSYFAFK
jgi:hypothetical protein